MGERRWIATHWGRYQATVNDGRIVAISPDPEDPDPSPIGLGVVRALGEGRLTRPMARRGWLEGPRRRGGNARGAEPFVELSWDEALDRIAAELTRVRETHGDAAVYGGSYGWASAGRFHHAQSQIHRFLALGGGFTDCVNTYSAGALEVILPHVIGGEPWSIFRRMPQWSEIAEHAELVVAFGGLTRKNMQVNSGGVGRHMTRDWHRRCRERGIAFVNVGPLRDDMPPELEARWLPLRPNTDVALMLGLAHTLIVEGWYDRAFVDGCCVGFERLREYLAGNTDGCPKDAAWAAAITGLERHAIRDLAREIADRRTLIAVSWSLQRAHHGEQPYWAGIALAALSGSMGRAGGGFGAGYGSMHSIGTRRSRHAVAPLPLPQNAVRERLPVSRIADALLHPGEIIDYDGRRLALPDLRLVYWCGGNPFHHHQDLNRLVRAWQQPETVIVHDSWWTASARFADVVLPVATAFERNDVVAGYQDAWLSASHKAAEPPPGARTDYEAFAALAERLGYRDAFTEGRSADAWVRELYERTRAQLAEQGVRLPTFERFWAEGAVELGGPPDDPLDTLRALRETGRPLSTPSGRIELFSETIDGFGYDDCPGHPAWLEPAEWLGSPQTDRFPLHLLTHQPRTRLHSQYDNGEVSRAAKVRGREPIALHPDDAAARGIREGDIVRVFNDRGACLAGARLTDAVRRGVVVMATGAWYDPAEPGTPGSLERHGNPNVLTLDRGTSRLAQGPSAQTTLVELERFPGAPPPVRAFAPPPLAERPASDRPA